MDLNFCLLISTFKHVSNTSLKMYTGGGGEGKECGTPPQANFKRLVNKIAVKPKIGDPPGNFIRKALTPSGILAKI
jgi:hypothetical protein